MGQLLLVGRDIQAVFRIDMRLQLRGAMVVPEVLALKLEMLMIGLGSVHIIPARFIILNAHFYRVPLSSAQIQTMTKYLPLFKT